MQRLSFPKQRSLLPACIALAAVLAVVVPAKWQAWVSPVSGLAEVLVSPVAGPLARFHRWLSPVPAPATDSRMAALEQDNQEQRTRVLSLLEENNRLRALLEQARVRPADSMGSVDQLAASVTGTGSDVGSPVLFVRAGAKQGVDVGSVATVQFVHLLGRVTGVRPRAATILPITSPASGVLDAIVVTAGVPGGLRTQLKPAGDGTLVGDVEDKTDANTQQPIEPKAGDEVRLADPTRWPMHAQMLIVGKVVSVEPSPRQPLRKTVVVRPVVGDLLRVSELVLQIPTSGTTDGRRVANEREEGGPR